MTPFETRRRRSLLPALLVVVVLLVLAAAGYFAWTQRDRVVQPKELYASAVEGEPTRAAGLYSQLGERLPAIEEYTQ